MIDPGGSGGFGRWPARADSCWGGGLVVDQTVQGHGSIQPGTPAAGRRTLRGRVAVGDGPGSGQAQVIESLLIASCNAGRQSTPGLLVQVTLRNQGISATDPTVQPSAPKRLVLWCRRSALSCRIMGATVLDGWTGNQKHWQHSRKMFRSSYGLLFVNGWRRWRIQTDVPKSTWISTNPPSRPWPRADPQEGSRSQRCSSGWVKRSTMRAISRAVSSPFSSHLSVVLRWAGGWPAARSAERSGPKSDHQCQESHTLVAAAGALYMLISVDVLSGASPAHSRRGDHRSRRWSIQRWPSVLR